MTPEQIRLVGDIVARVRANDQFAERFYERLFAAVPDARAMFSDLDAQRAKLSSELTTLLDLLGDLETLEQRAAELGARHRGYGVKAPHYRAARTAMADTLHDLLGAEFGPTERAAWDRATSLVTELMQSR